MLCISRRHKLKILHADNSTLSCSTVIRPFRCSTLYAGHLPAAYREALSFRLRGKGSAGQRVRPRPGGGQDRTVERGTKASPCMGGHSTGMAEAGTVVLSVGTEEPPDPGHLVDDFQRTAWDKLCVCDGCVHSHASLKPVCMYIHLCLSCTRW